MIARYAVPLFLVVAFFAIPLAAYFLCRWLLPRRWGRHCGIACACIIIGIAAYGMFFGFEQLEVRHIEYASPDIPEAFDGYRIVQFSDAHVGSMTGIHKGMLERAIDSIMDQHADMIVFTGDLQNIMPEELHEHLPQLRRLRATDGVLSVLGNHDYDCYQTGDSIAKQANCRMTCQMEREAGWSLLSNEHRIIHRGADSIVIGGMENWGDVKRMPRRGNVAQTLQGIDTTAFVVMLQHDPSAWRQKILPECHAQLTLSGHTHGMQFAIFGWSPMSLKQNEWGGMFREGNRALYVSTGLGGLVPFRLGLPGEIVVITLHHQP